MPKIGNPKSVLIAEPNLLIPGKKPVGAVRLSDKYTSSIFRSFLLQNTGASIYDHKKKDLVAMPATAPTWHPRGLDFDSSLECVYGGNDSDFPDTGTLIFKWERNVDPANSRYFYIRNAYNEFAMYQAVSTDAVRIYVWGTDNPLGEISSFLDYKPHIFCIVYERNSSGTLYVDGASISSFSCGNTRNDNTFVFGGRNGSSDRFCGGIIHHFTIYNKKLSAGEIQELCVLDEYAFVQV